ncbi:MAG: 3-isopropylmalate dehydratase [Myxococcales bacterium]|nr:3-isopropylmalate dehydratase [Myxococcales bacterium]
MTLTQKILAHHAIGLERPWVQAGDILRIRVDWTIASELAWNGMDRTYTALGRPGLANSRRFFLAVDHTVDPTTLATDPRAQRLAGLSRDFARESGIRHFYDANVTILHTKFYRDLILPGQVVLGADSHTSSHGGMGAFAIGLGGADVTAAMVLGQSWIEVPEAICIEYLGTPPFGIGGKDVILATLGALGRNTVAMERSVEYRGTEVSGFSTDMRFTIANMTAEFGGLNGLFEADEVCAAWIAARGDGEEKEGARYFRADDDAPYVARHAIDLARLGPQLARPFAPDNVVPVADEAGRRLDGVFIGACTTTEEELVLGALVLEAQLAEGRRPIASEKRLAVPGDLTIERHLREAGLAAIYERAGFAVDPPGCSMCLGVASRKAGSGEHWLSSQNRNFRNRMGDGSHAYLASAATVAASALELVVTDPSPWLAGVREKFERILGRGGAATVGAVGGAVVLDEPEIDLAPATAPVGDGTAATAPAGDGTATAAAASSSASGARAALCGRVQRFGDHVDTDAIIPGQFCHLTEVADLGAKCFHIVRPEFAARVAEGRSVVVAGDGWGSGSSREQAVWALQGAGVQAVIAKSYAFIHKRNLVNEALPYLVLDDAAFHELAQEDAEVVIDLATSTVTVAGRSFAARGATPMIRALQRAGGLVPAIARHGQGVFTRLSQET